jgi:hypothetical protein
MTVMRMPVWRLLRAASSSDAPALLLPVYDGVTKFLQEFLQENASTQYHPSASLMAEALEAETTLQLVALYPYLTDITASDRDEPSGLATTTKQAVKEYLLNHFVGTSGRWTHAFVSMMGKMSAPLKYKSTFRETIKRWLGRSLNMLRPKLLTASCASKDAGTYLEVLERAYSFNDRHADGNFEAYLMETSPQHGTSEMTRVRHPEVPAKKMAEFWWQAKALCYFMAKVVPGSFFQRDKYLRAAIDHMAKYSYLFFHMVNKAVKARTDVTSDEFHQLLKTGAKKLGKLLFRRQLLNRQSKAVQYELLPNGVVARAIDGGPPGVDAAIIRKAIRDGELTRVREVEMRVLQREKERAEEAALRAGEAASRSVEAASRPESERAEDTFRVPNARGSETLLDTRREERSQDPRQLEIRMQEGRRRQEEARQTLTNLSCPDHDSDACTWVTVETHPSQGPQLEWSEHRVFSVLFPRES